MQSGLSVRLLIFREGRRWRAQHFWYGAWGKIFRPARDLSQEISTSRLALRDLQRLLLKLRSAALSRTWWRICSSVMPYSFK